MVIFVLPEDGDCSLGGEFQRFDFGDCGLEHSGLLVVSDDSLVEVETAVLEVGVLLLGLRGVVVSPQLGHEVTGVLGGIDGQGLGDHQQGLGEVSDGELLPTGERGGEVLQIDGEGGLHPPPHSCSPALSSPRTERRGRTSPSRHSRSRWDL